MAKIESIIRVCKAQIDKKGNCGYQQPTCSPLNKLCREDAVTLFDTPKHASLYWD